MPDAGLPPESTAARRFLARSMARLRGGCDDELVTRIRKLEAALAAADERLRQEEATRQRIEAAMLEVQKLHATGQLAGGIAHDFNNHLATILGSLELIERRLAAAAGDPDEAGRMQTLIERGIEAVQRGARLTACLLALSRRQRGAGHPADLNSLVGDVVLLAAGTLGRGVTVETDLAPGLWPVAAEPGHVETAILNLCLNARDAMPEAGRLTIATANVSLAEPGRDGLPPGDYVRLIVADTGCGMTDEVADKAPAAFFSTKGSTAGGLGLTQVSGLAQRCGGAMRIASAVGRGTEVMLLLPRDGRS
jgi:signal transduction histidine kinase